MPAWTRGAPSNGCISSTCRDASWLKETRRALRTKHKINSVCFGIQKQADVTMNKYSLSVCMVVLWRANRSDFTDSWFSPYVISIHNFQLYKLIKGKKKLYYAPLFLIFSPYLKAQKRNCLHITKRRRKERKLERKVLDLLFLFQQSESNWKWPRSAHFHEPLSGWAFAQL